MIKFYANTNIIVIGASSTGKTTTVLQILKLRLIEPFPPNIIYLFGARQPFMDDWNTTKTNPKIDFYEGLQLDVIQNYQGPKILIIDDLMMEQSKELTQHFIAGSRHSQTTTIYISHRVFLNDSNYRILSNNCSYMILLKSKRNRAEIARLAKQVLGAESSRLMEGYKSIMSEDYGSVLLSFHNKVPEELIVTTNWLTECLNAFL